MKQHEDFLRNAFPAGTMYTYDEIEILRKQEKEMNVANTQVFEYCIVNFNEDGSPYVAKGPELIVTIGEEAPRDVALLRIGSKHADVINDDSEVRIRPFC